MPESVRLSARPTGLAGRARPGRLQQAQRREWARRVSRARRHDEQIWPADCGARGAGGSDATGDMQIDRASLFISSYTRGRTSRAGQPDASVRARRCRDGRCRHFRPGRQLGRLISASHLASGRNCSRAQVELALQRYRLRSDCPSRKWHRSTNLWARSTLADWLAISGKRPFALHLASTRIICLVWQQTVSSRLRVVGRLTWAPLAAPTATAAPTKESLRAPINRGQLIIVPHCISCRRPADHGAGSPRLHTRRLSRRI